jgi:putative transposase
MDRTPRKKGIPYAADLRSQVISAVQAGLSSREAAARYGLSKSAVGKWVLRFRRSGSVAAKSTGGDSFSPLKRERDWMLSRIATRPDLTPVELHQELSARGVRVGYLSVKRFLKREKLESQ